MIIFISRALRWIKGPKEDSRIIASAERMQRSAERVVRAVQAASDDAERGLRLDGAPRG